MIPYRYGWDDTTLTSEVTASSSTHEATEIQGTRMNLWPSAVTTVNGKHWNRGVGGTSDVTRFLHATWASRATTHHGALCSASVATTTLGLE